MELQEACGSQSDKGSGSGFPVAIWPKMTAFSLIMIDGWMDDLPFYFLFTVFQSYQDVGQMMMKGCGQWNPVLG